MLLLVKYLQINEVQLLSMCYYHDMLISMTSGNADSVFCSSMRPCRLRVLTTGCTTLITTFCRCARYIVACIALPLLVTQGDIASQCHAYIAQTAIHLYGSLQVATCKFCLHVLYTP